jgi:hypothetical protein
MASNMSEHAVRCIFTYIINHIDKDTNINNFELINLNKYKEGYLTLDNLLEITNYNKYKYHFKVSRPIFLKYGTTNLEIDCYSEKKKIGLEVDSKEHYYNTLELLKEQKERDKFKDEKCKENNYKLYRISYKDYNKGLKETKECLFKLINKDHELHNFEKEHYDEFIKDDFDIINNMINNNFGKEHSYKIISIIEHIINGKLDNYKFNKQVLNIKHCQDVINIICNNNHEYTTIYQNSFSDSNRKRGCPFCSKTDSQNNDKINSEIYKYGFVLVEEYCGKSWQRQNYNSLCLFNHIILSSWDNMHKRKIDGCLKCKYKELLNNIKIYKYDLKDNLIVEFEDIKYIPNKDGELNNVDFKVRIRDNIKERKNYNTVNGYKYSFIEPIDNKLVRYRDNLNNYNELEQFIITKYKLVIINPGKKKNRVLTPKCDDKRGNLEYTIKATNKKTGKCYLFKNASDALLELKKIGFKIKALSSINRALNRENNTCGGYIWEKIFEE